MRALLFIAVVLLTATANAQSVYSGYFRVGPSLPSSGNGVQVGGGVDLVYDSGSWLLDVDASYVREAKLYVGDGQSIRTQGEALVRLGKGVYAGGGMAAGRHINSDYAKNQFLPMASIHYRPSMKSDLYFTYLFPAFGNADRVTGYRGGYRATIPTSKRVGLFSQIEYTHFAFTSNGKRYQSGSVMFGIGISAIR